MEGGGSMDFQKDKQELVTRLAVCVVAALVVYYGGEKLCTALELPFWEQYRPWLEKNRIQAVALVAAALFGLSLAVLPLEGQGARTAAPEETAPDGFEPCQPPEEMGFTN